MDVREKLVELANDVLRYLPWGEIQKDTAERIADRMIDHGVTVQDVPDNNVDKWISVNDRLPEDEKKVLCILDDGFFCILEWVSWDWLWNDGHNVYAEKDVTHWMPLPQPPKGE